MSGKAQGTLSYTVPAGTTCLWLVVMGAPGTYIPLTWGRHHDTRHYCTWPYAIRLKGTGIYAR